MSKPVQISPSSAKTAAGASSWAAPDGPNVSVLVDITAVSGTTPTLSLFVEWSHDGVGSFAADPADGFTQITAVGKKVKSFTAKAPYYRLVWSVGGTTPSFTFSAVSYSQDAQ